MFSIRLSEDGDINVVKIIGKLDSNTAPNLETALLKIDTDKIRIDCSELEYISSAGLRILLRLRKESEFMELVNVSGLVNEILDITGFNEVLNINKEYRCEE